MPIPANRTPIRIARGTWSELNAFLAELKEGELALATDQETIYVKWDGQFVRVSAYTGVGSVNGQVGDVELSLGDITDVNTALRVDGSVLTYDQPSGLFKADDINTLTTITDGGHF